MDNNICSGPEITRKTLLISCLHIGHTPFSRDLTIPHLDLSHFALCIMGNYSPAAIIRNSKIMNIILLTYAALKSS